jgi:inhibitor of KinA sporulation pathway (predicted exonuclease)
MDLAIFVEDSAQEISRSVTLTNDQWLILSQCVESFTDKYRAQHSQTIATYVTRGQLDEAQIEARRMNDLLQQLDKLQAKLV